MEHLEFSMMIHNENSFEIGQNAEHNGETKQNKGKNSILNSTFNWNSNNIKAVVDRKKLPPQPFSTWFRSIQWFWVHG